MEIQSYPKGKDFGIQNLGLEAGKRGTQKLMVYFIIVTIMFVFLINFL